MLDNLKEKLFGGKAKSPELPAEVELNEELLKEIDNGDRHGYVESFLENEGKWTKAYSPSKLLETVKKYAKKAGVTTIYYVLLLYHALLSDKISGLDKTLAVAALGYFITPVDIIPDFIPGGLVDDASILMYALGVLGEAVDDEIESKAKNQLKAWFNDDDVFQIDSSDVNQALDFKSKFKAGKKIWKLLR